MNKLSYQKGFRLHNDIDRQSLLRFWCSERISRANYGTKAFDFDLCSLLALLTCAVGQSEYTRLEILNSTHKIVQITTTLSTPPMLTTCRKKGGLALRISRPTHASATCRERWPRPPSEIRPSCCQRGEKKHCYCCYWPGDGRWAMGDGRRQHPSQYVHVYTRTSSKAIPLCVSVAALAWVANSDGLQGSPKNVLVKDSQLFVRRSSASTAARAMLQASGRVSLESCLFASANMCVCYLLAYSPCYRGSWSYVRETLVRLSWLRISFESRAWERIVLSGYCAMHIQE